MPITLAEGQAGSTADKIIYPEISTCMTLTAICGGSIVGGHASLFAPHGAMGIDGIVDYISLRSGTQTKLLVLGELGVWRDNYPGGRFADYNAAIAALTPAGGGGVAPVVRIDTGGLHGGTAAADIEVSLSDRTYKIWRRRDNVRHEVMASGMF